MTTFEHVSEAAAFVRSRLGRLTPQIAIVLGSGLGAVAEAVGDPVVVPFAEVPHFPKSTVEGHSGRIVAGSLGGRRRCRAARPSAFLRGLYAAASDFPCACAGRIGGAGTGADECGRGHCGRLSDWPACCAGRPHQPDGLQPAGWSQ